MRPGTVFFHTRFPFRDTPEHGKKLCIVLNDGSIGHYVVVKTTSKQHRFSATYGCQPPPARFPAFYLPLHTNTFRKDTWVQLDDFFHFNNGEIIVGGLNGYIIQQFLLPKRFLREIIECALLSEDLPFSDEDVLKKALLVI
ncbi:MAG: hypothetical protein G8345_12070 [Magnetococcales bacterium]|nr:hypothetical protein [Magnetococcales bacterium]NGZ27608.1 hypothetical protein [Magnetococcales bacterium]